MSKAALLHTGAHIRFIREPELLACTGLSATAIDILEARGEFPRRVPLGERAVGWVDTEVAEWQRRRIAMRDDGATEEQARRKRRVPAENAGAHLASARAGVGRSQSSKLHNQSGELTRCTREPPNASSTSTPISCIISTLSRTRS